MPRTFLATLTTSRQRRWWSFVLDSLLTPWFVFVVVSAVRRVMLMLFVMKNMGQRYVELQTSYTGYRQNNTATLHVAQLPPNPAIIVPGPAFIFVVVNGVPSIGLPVMLGSGNIEKQPILAPASLPTESIVEAPTGTSTGSHASTSAARPVMQGSGALGWIVALCSTLVVLSLSLW